MSRLLYQNLHLWVNYVKFYALYQNKKQIYKKKYVMLQGIRRVYIFCEKLLHVTWHMMHIDAACGCHSETLSSMHISLC